MVTVSTLIGVTLVAIIGIIVCLVFITSQQVVTGRNFLALQKQVIQIDQRLAVLETDEAIAQRNKRRVGELVDEMMER